MSFRETFTSIHSKECNPKNYSLSQAKGLREGFGGIPDDLTSNQSMYNMWGTDDNNTSEVGKKREDYNLFETITYSPSGSDSNNFKEWAYKAATFSIHKQKMDEELVKCRKRCNEVVISSSGDEGVKQKNIEGCQIGCTVAYPRYANATSTYMPLKDQNDEAWTEEATQSAKLAAGRQECQRLADENICRYGVIISDGSAELDKVGAFGGGSPRTNCKQCGGINAIMGKWSYKYDNLRKDGNTIANGGLITDTNTVDNQGTLNISDSGSGLGCNNIVDSIVKNACLCASNNGGSNCDEINNVKFGSDGTTTIKTNAPTSEFAEDLNKFGSVIGQVNAPWRQSDSEDKSISQRYKEMKDAAAKYQVGGEATATQFNLINDFIRQTPEDIKSLEDKLNTNMIKIQQYGMDMDKAKIKKRTIDGRMEDSILKREAQLYRNWALGVLAISVGAFAINKLRQI